MKKIIMGSLAALFLLSSCQNREEAKNTSTSHPSENKASSEKILEVPWMAVYNDTTQKLELKKNPAADISNLNGQDIIDALNIKYPQIKLEWVKLEGNKVFVKIADPTYLTQQIGTTGTEVFFAEATFSLTEIKGINAVYFDFKEGDHASPETFTRDSFKDFH